MALRGFAKRGACSTAYRRLEQFRNSSSGAATDASHGHSPRRMPSYGHGHSQLHGQPQLHGHPRGKQGPDLTHSHSVHRGALRINDGPRKRRIGYEVHSTAESCSTSGLIWTHGLTSSVHNESSGGWPFAGVSSLANVLPVTRYDARGHGSSDCPGDGGCTWPELGSDLVQLRRAWSKQRTVLGGTSMGAAATLYAALEDPEGVSAIILATPPTCYGQRKQFVPMYLESLEFARKHGLHEAKRIAAGQTRPPIFMESERGRDMFELSWESKLSMGVDRYVAALKGAAESDLPPRERLQTISVPTLILAWRSDVQHPVVAAEMLRETLPNSELYVASSWSDIENFPDRMRNFLRRLL